MEIAGLLSLPCVLGSALLFVTCFRTGKFVEKGLLFFFGLTAQIVLLAYLLSSIGRLDSAGWWLAASATVLAALCITALVSRSRAKATPPDRPPDRWDGVEDRSHLRTMILAAMGGTVALCGAANLVVVVFCAPGTWDCMAYQLARAAYYIQQGSFAPFDANYWAQVVHPVNSTALAVFTLVTTGSENLIQLWQYLSYWASLLAVFGIASAAGFTGRAALAGALVFGLLITCLMEASTAQNDLFITAGVGGAIYFFLAWRRAPAAWRLILSGVCIGLAAGAKASALLVLPSLIVIALCAATVRPDAGRERVRSPGGAILRIGVALGCALLFVLPAGYLRNIELVGHPVAPAEVRAEHSFEGRSLGDRIRAGTRNALRYAIEFLAIDGAPPVSAARTVQDTLRSVPLAALERVSCGLESDVSSDETREPYSLNRPPASHEDESYFGILGFGLVLPIGLLVILRLLRPPVGWMLAAAAVVFFLTQSFVGPFDPWRGRYFMILGLLLAPLAGYYLAHGRSAIVVGYCALVVAAGCLSALSAVAFHEGRALFPAEESFFGRSRIAQLTVNRPKYTQAVERFEEFVPRDAVVAVCLEPNSHEYPLFGPDRTRRIIPLNSFSSGLKPVPSGADFLLYDHRRVRVSPFYAPTDLRLGKDWYLRKLTTRGRGQ